MKTQKSFTFKIKISDNEAKLLEEALFKILAVENTHTPHVVKTLNDKEVKLLEEIYNTLKPEKQ